MISKEHSWLKGIVGLMESRAVYYIIAGLLVLFVVLQVVLTAGAEPGITGLKIAQDKDHIKVSWKDRKGADAYLIRVEDKKSDKTKVIKTSKLSCSVPCNDIPGSYRVSVRSVGSSDGNSDFPTAKSETIKLKKYSQKISSKSSFFPR